MRVFWVLILLFSPTIAYAQAPAKPQSSFEQALAGKLVTEIQSGLQCNAALVDAQKELEQLRARVKELEPKESKEPK